MTTSFKDDGKNVELELFNGSFNPGFLQMVMFGEVPGVSTNDKFGENPSIATGGVPADITEIGGLYNWISKGSPAAIDTASSSSASDVGQKMVIYGIIDPDNDDGESVGYFELNGQNKVNFYDNPELTGDPISFWRTHRMANVSDEGNGLVGDVYAYIDTVVSGGVPADLTKVRAKITNGNNQTLMSVYTTRPKEVCFLYRGEIGISRGVSSAEVRAAYYSRRYGKCFRVKKRVNLSNSGTSIYFDKRSFPDIIPALTDIRLTVESTSATIGACGTFNFLRVK